MRQIVPLPVSAPYNLEATVRLLQRRPANRIDRWENSGYERAFQTYEGMRLVRVANAGTIDDPNLQMGVVGDSAGESELTEIAATVRWVLGLDQPPAPDRFLAQREPRVAGTGARSCSRPRWRGPAATAPSSTASASPARPTWSACPR